MAKKYDGVIRITIDPEDTEEYFEDYLSKLPPEARGFALRSHVKASLMTFELLGHMLKEIADTLWKSQMEIPPATRERSQQLKIYLLQSKSISQIADLMFISKRQVKRDMKWLGISLRKGREK